MTTIYFDDRALIIRKRNATLEQAEDHQENYQVVTEPDAPTLAALMQRMMQDKQLKATIYSSDTGETLRAVESNFKKILAAGGLVSASNGQTMLIFRKGKWDLPKGKLDEGESLEACALREVEEETGVRQLKMDRFLHKTYHTYTEKNKGILKETHWYHLTTHLQPLQAQTEEGIEQCIWVDDRDLSKFTKNMHQSVKDVMSKAAASGIITVF